MTRALLLVALALLAACGRAPVKPAAPSASGTNRVPPNAPDSRTSSSSPVPRARPDAPGEYTAGGLYRPGVRDSGPAVPPDISALQEPVPRAEPLARYGNRSPYTVLGRSYHVMKSADNYVQRGIASWYGEKFHGRATSSLEPYDMYAFTAAHKTLPLPSYARVTNLDNGRSVVVRVNDRGPFHADRLIDLSYVAAIRIGMHVQGTARVEVRALQPDGSDGGAVADAPATVAGSLRRDAAVSDGPVWLQVGSFADRDNARSLVRRLEDAKIRRIKTRRGELRGDRVWRVRIGPFDDRSDAERLAMQLSALGFGPSTIVADQ